MTTRNVSADKIRAGCVFFETPEDFKIGGQYRLELVFYTGQSEDFPLTNFLKALHDAFDYLWAQPRKTLINLPAVQITTCKVYKPSGLKAIAEWVASYVSKFFGGMEISVLPAVISVCD